MLYKDTFFIRVFFDNAPEICGIGECPIFRGLSAEDTPRFEVLLAQICHRVSESTTIEDAAASLPEISSIRFGFEQALADLAGGGCRFFFDTPWARGETAQQINGLIWMGTREEMLARIREKLEGGFRCVKLKIGGINFEDELELLKYIRKEFGPEDIELRLDANGAFSVDNALERLHRLAPLHIHSIEQPIKPGQWEKMAEICVASPIAVALDEELIGFTEDNRKTEMLSIINPKYVILKPALCGGFSEATKWISTAEQHHIGWWATSALESDLGLDGIGQWVSGFCPKIPQGLGTGRLYSNNINSPLHLDGQYLRRIPTGVPYNLPPLSWQN